MPLRAVPDSAAGWASPLARGMRELRQACGKLHRHPEPFVQMQVTSASARRHSSGAGPFTAAPSVRAPTRRRRPGTHSRTHVPARRGRARSRSRPDGTPAGPAKRRWRKIRQRRAACHVSEGEHASVACLAGSASSCSNVATADQSWPSSRTAGRRVPARGARAISNRRTSATASAGDSGVSQRRSSPPHAPRRPRAPVSGLVGIVSTSQIPCPVPIVNHDGNILGIGGNQTPISCTHELVTSLVAGRVSALPGGTAGQTVPSDHLATQHTHALVRTDSPRLTTLRLREFGACRYLWTSDLAWSSDHDRGQSRDGMATIG
jgi:hypothetical protein